jgi:adenylate kinase family enzyme
MKICIIGSTGSGKTTTASTLSKRYSVAAYLLDEIVWDNSTGYVGKKQPEEVRDGAIARMLVEESWIAEGIYSKEWMLPVFHAADFVLILSPSKLVRDYRLVKRYLRSKMCNEEPKEDLVFLYKNITWGHAFERNEMSGLLDLLNREQIRYYQYSGVNAAAYASERMSMEPNKSN